MKKNKAIFLDRDGTINIDYGYVCDNDKLKFVDGAIEGLKRLKEKGYILIIITNQSGIGRGYFTKSEYEDFNKFFLKELSNIGIEIDKVYHCPHVDEDNCDCRKPKTKLFCDAIKEFNIDEENSYAIGDKIRDLSICDVSNIKGILLGTNSKKYICVNNLLEASNYILNNI